MKIQAISRYVRIAPRKAREITREIQGLPASRALEVVQVVPRKGARLVARVLKSAIANAENNPPNVSVERLKVREAVVQTGSILKRYAIRARGGGSPIRKRTSHIKIVLSDE